MIDNDFRPTQRFSMPEPNEDLEEPPIVVSLKKLVSRHKTSVETLRETTSAISAVLEETISASDGTIRLASNIKEEAENRAAMMISEAQRQATQIIDEAERDCRNLTQKTMSDIHSTLEAAMQQTYKGLLGDPENPEQETTAQASEEESPQPEFGDRVNGHESRLLESAKAEPTDSESLSATRQEPLEPPVSSTDVDEDAGPRGEEILDEGVESLQKTTPIDQENDTPETIAVDEEENSSQTGLIGDNGPEMEPSLYTGHVEMAIHPNKPNQLSSRLNNHLTPNLLSSRIRNTTGARIMESGGLRKLGDLYFIDVYFGSPVSLDEVLVGVTKWEEVNDQGDKVNVFLKRERGQKPHPDSEESSEKKRILVTL